MLYLGMPYGSTFGWGVLGKEIALAMADLTELRILSPPRADQRLADEFDAYRITRLLANPQDHGTRTEHGWQMNGPVIHAVITRGLDPFVPGLAPPAAVGYAVFEETVFAKDVIEHARRSFRRLAVASNYCAEILRGCGISDVTVIPHGVDSTLFCPRSESRSFLTDRFVIFSGGKFELRKAQDIVIRAYKVLQDRHKDVMLVNAWHNSWPKTRDTMASSKLIRYFPPKNRDHTAWINGLLSAHGIDRDRVITTGPRDHRLLPSLYHATDLGLFPNRAEGGNNMVLMEYLACGKPVLAAYNSGHKDIVRRQNAILIESHRSMEIRDADHLSAVWSDPSLEETIEKLEWCYQNRGQLQSIAQQAPIDMRQFSWRRLAEGLLNLCDAEFKRE